MTALRQVEDDLRQAQAQIDKLLKQSSHSGLLSRVTDVAASVLRLVDKGVNVATLTVSTERLLNEREAQAFAADVAAAAMRVLQAARAQAQSEHERLAQFLAVLRESRGLLERELNTAQERLVANPYADVDLTSPAIKERLSQTELALRDRAEAQLALAQTERDWQQAEATFAEVAATAQTAGNRPAEYEAMLGLAEVARRRGLFALAMERLTAVLPHLPTQSAQSWAAPVQAYVRCAHILRAAHDADAEVMLGQGVCLLDHLAQQINDDDLRQNFLSAVPAHRELKALQVEVLVGA